MTKEYTGGSVSYYSVKVSQPTSGKEPYMAECNDIIEALKMNYAEGNAFKAIWRRAAASNLGLSKQGYKDGLYDAEKVVFFGKRMIEQEKMNASKDRSGQPESEWQTHHNYGAGVSTFHPCGAYDTPSVQPERAEQSSCPTEEELESIPSIADVLRKECSWNEQQGTPFPIPNYFMQSPMGGCSVRGSSISFPDGEGRPSQAMGQPTS